MKQKIENLLYSLIDDFSTKWKSHEEKNDGITDYANKILALQQPAVSVEVCDFIPKQVCSHHGSDFYNKTCKKCSYFKQTDR